MRYEEENNYPKAFLATGIILAVMLLLCYFIVFKDPGIVDDGNGGILVNYGTTDQGMGTDVSSTEQPSVAEKANKTAPDKVIKAPPTEQKTQVDKSVKNIVTQNNEDAASVATNPKKTSNDVASQVAKPVRKPVVNQNALYKGSANKGNGQGDGTSSIPGNQGVSTGSALASNYGKGGTGNGVGGTQWSFVSMPDVKNTHRVQGRVVINVVIDKDGNIITADYDRRQTTNPDLELIDKCITEVKNSRLTSPKQGSGNQKGQVVFQFNVD